MLSKAMETALEHVQLAFSDPPHLRYEDSVYVWFTHPAGAVVQLQRPERITIPITHWLVETAFAELVRRFPTNRALTVVFDYSLMLGRTSASRSLFLGKVRESGNRFAQAYVVLPPLISPALKRSVEASLRVAGETGIEARLIGSVRQAIATCALVAAPAA
jgi:hypothetical protein